MIKLFEEFSLETYWRVNNEEYWKLFNNSSIDMINSEKFKLFKKLNSQPNYKLVDDTHSGNLLSTPSDISKIDIRLMRKYTETNSIYGNTFDITYLEDEYYLLRFGTSLPELSNYFGEDSIIDFKCDQMNGLVECIDYLLSILNKIYNK